METKQDQLKEPVFVVDDEADIREMMADFIKESGFNTILFSSAKEALSKIVEVRPFMVFSDFNMPELNGLEFCAKVRETNGKLPFILVTAHADKDLAIAGFPVGITEIVEKPFGMEIIGALLSKYGGRRIAEIAAEKKELDEIAELFAEEVLDLLNGREHLILRLEEDPLDVVMVDSLFRKFHSIKGGAMSIPGGKQLGLLAHAFESLLSKVKTLNINPNSEIINLMLVASDLCVKLAQTLKAKEEPTQELINSVNQTIDVLKKENESFGIQEKAKGDVTTSKPSVESLGIQQPKTDEVSEEDGILVSNDKLDSFMGLSGELIVLKNAFQMLTRDQKVFANELAEKKMGEFLYNLNKLADQVQWQIISIRKVKLARAFNKLNRIARQTAQEAGKKVKLNLVGMELGVDKNIAKSLGSSLVHMVRNSIDHGIEPPPDRIARGKSPEGSITVSASENHGMIQIVVSDDGAGIDRERVLKKALEKELIKAGTDVSKPQFSDEEVFDLIFKPGFSTAEKVTSISGRGVGMDVVKTEVLAHDGKIVIKSVKNEGTTFNIDLPVPKTVMVEQTILVRSGDSVFAVPLTAVSRIVSCNELKISEVEKIRVCQFEGDTAHLLAYPELLKKDKILDERDIQGKVAVIMRNKSRAMGLIVDEIMDQMEAVIRPFDSIVRELPGFIGTTVLGNDSIAYIVSVEKMFELFNGAGTLAA